MALSNGRQLKDWRTENRLRKEEVSAHLKISISTYSKMEADRPVDPEYWDRAFAMMRAPVKGFQIAV